MTSDLERLTHLRALRERRAEAVAAGLRLRAEAARRAEEEARSALLAHDAAEAERDAAAHDALLARGFTHADLLDAEARAHHAARDRDALARGMADAAAAFEHASAERAVAEDTLHRASRRHDAIGVLADGAARHHRQRAEALSETEAEDTPRR